MTHNLEAVIKYYNSFPLIGEGSDIPWRSSHCHPPPNGLRVLPKHPLLLPDDSSVVPFCCWDHDELRHIKCINNQFTAFKNEFFYLDCNNKYDHFTFVECDYLQIIKKKNVEKARKIAEAVYKRRIESQASKKRDSALLMEETQH